MTNKIIFLSAVSLFMACKGPETSEPLFRQPIAMTTIEVKEPSGLSINHTGDGFMVPSDNKNKIYELSFSGIVKKVLDYKGTDIEGVTQLADGSVWIVEEQSNDLVHLNEHGEFVEKISIPIIQEESKHGLEGITFDELSNEFYLLAEKNPARLIKLNSSGSIIEEYDLTFAKDYSGIYYSSSENLLYIVSDQSQLFAKCDLTGNPIEIYNFEIPKAEGITVDKANKKVYIVSDKTQGLYTFQVD